MAVFLCLIAINLACTKEEKNENTPTNEPLTMEEKVGEEWKMTEWTHETNGISGGQTVFTSTELGSDFPGSRYDTG